MSDLPTSVFDLTGGVCRFAARGALGAAVKAVSRARETGKEMARTMGRDMEAIRQRDPAAHSDVEILTCYPGLHAVWLHRAARYLWKREVPVVPRIVSQAARLLTGIEIHPGATLGEGLFIDHGGGHR
jgi:serine acetyltransferase